MHALNDAQTPLSISLRYMAPLRRNYGQLHPWEDPSGNRFMASVAAIAPDGTLSLQHEDGTRHDYLFKQVKHIISGVSL